ncbi:hypothetical protein EFW17_12090 [Halostreptopolyspora alba]|uniref:DUF3367 domain-containing protein n=1 Tax=Halostreptopolyspora alba TaxID=2487137 RepID=A0A3N0EA24_9ACTN|nr:hypothetical protein EFW17_12090 [Nocardiopsaceae bacterium YIM 96095]
MGPGLAPGLVLRYDMVFVPDPPLSEVILGAGSGFPRAVPSDAVVGALGLLLPTDLVQASLLLTIFTLGAAGAARLVPGGAVVPGVAAGLCYVWNPFVAERLLLGQWAMLLGYAGLPWVVAAATRAHRARDLPRLVVSLVPAAVGGFSATVLSALVAVPTTVLRGRAFPRLWRAACPVVLLGSALLVVSLPWLVPALGSDARTDPAAVDAFAARSDTPFGVVGSLFTLGGIWNSHAVPAGYGHPFLAAGRLALALVAVAGWVWLLRRFRPDFGAGLTAAAATGFAVALVGVVEPGRELLRALIEGWPGFGPLRDGQLYVAPLALLQAVGFGGVARWLWGEPARASLNERGAQGEPPMPGVAEGVPFPSARPRRPWARSDAVAGPVAAALLVLAPVVLLPTLAWGAAGRLAPVEYPADWERVRHIVAQDSRPGAVLSLPWSAHRGVDWRADGRTVVVLDPAVKLFERRVVFNDDLRVGAGSGVRVVEGEDPLSRRVAPLLDPERPYEAAPDLPSRLGELGVRYVLVERAAADEITAATGGADHSGKNMFWGDLPGVRTSHHGDDLLLLELPDRHVDAESANLSGLEVTGWLVTVGAIIWSLVVSGSSLVPMRPGRSAGAVSREESFK